MLLFGVRLEQGGEGRDVLGSTDLEIVRKCECDGVGMGRVQGDVLGESPF